MNKILMLASACVTFVSCGGKAAPDEVMKAKRLIESNASTIWHAAHPTVQKYKIKFDGQEKTPEGYHVRYVFDADRGFKTVFGFHFNPQGLLSGIDPEEIVEVVEDSAPVKAFAGSDASIGALRTDLKNRIEKLPSGVRGELKSLIDRKLTPKGVVGVWLRYKEVQTVDKRR